ncbi:hypothetical protein [Actinomycetospora chlora]|jgi:hypothetical protein|uniref:hypothetical protein n=1 Tax=Actinomycetospora chlora TaxID=663608 RepID=UPI0031E931BD
MNATSGPRRRPTGPHPERSAPEEPSVPAQRTAADVYGVSDDQVHRARIAVARNSLDSHDCRELLDMLGLIGEGGDPPPVRR